MKLIPWDARRQMFELAQGVPFETYLRNVWERRELNPPAAPQWDWPVKRLVDQRPQARVNVHKLPASMRAHAANQKVAI